MPAALSALTTLLSVELPVSGRLLSNIKSKNKVSVSLFVVVCDRQHRTTLTYLRTFYTRDLTRTIQMIEHLSPSRLRANLYRILDQVLASGEPVEIERKGRRLRIVAEQEGKLDLLKPHSAYLKVPPEDIVYMDWSKEWHP